MNRDSLSIDALALEELQWLSSCITVDSHEPSTPPRKTTALPPLSCPPKVQSNSSSISKRKRDVSTESPRRPVAIKRASNDLPPPRFKGLYDSTDSETERRDRVGPLRVQRGASLDRTTRLAAAGLASRRQSRRLAGSSLADDTSAVEGALRSLEGLSGSSREKSPSARERSKSPVSAQTELSGVPSPEVLHTSSSLPTRSPLSARRQTGYFDFNIEPLSPRSSLRGRRKTRSVTQQQIPPSWTAILRSKSKSQRSPQSLKARPSQSLSVKVTPPVSFLKASPISWHSREPSLVSDNGTSESGHSSFDMAPPSPPLPIPRIPAAEEDVFGRSSPTFLPETFLPAPELPLPVDCSLSTSSLLRSMTPRKNSGSSSVTSSTISREGSITPIGSHRSVKFAERVHFQSTLKWDKGLDPLDSLEVDEGVDVDGMELEEIPEMDPVPEDANSDASSESCYSDDGEGPTTDEGLPSKPEDSRCSSPALSLTGSVIKGSYITGFMLFSTKKEVKAKEISGPFTLGVGIPARRSSQETSRPVTPTPVSRPTTPSLMPSTPVSRPQTPSSRPVTPSSTPSRRRGRLVKQKSGVTRQPHMYPLSSAPLPNNVIGSTESFRSARSVDAKSCRSVPESRKGSAGRRWWNRFGAAPPLPTSVVVS